MKKIIFCLIFLLSSLHAIPPYPAGYYPPVLSTTAIIVIEVSGHTEGIVLIERGKAPFGFALPGGKVEYGESVEDAIRREMRKEVNLELDNLKQFHVYSDPARDPRHHTVEVTHTARAYGIPKAGDDAARAHIVPLDKIPWNHLAFDHALILRDYLRSLTDNKK